MRSGQRSLVWASRRPPIPQHAANVIGPGDHEREVIETPGCNGWVSRRVVGKESVSKDDKVLALLRCNQRYEPLKLATAFAFGD